jgi:hypothetical protein
VEIKAETAETATAPAADAAKQERAEKNRKVGNHCKANFSEYQSISTSAEARTKQCSNEATHRPWQHRPKKKGFGSACSSSKAEQQSQSSSSLVKSKKHQQQGSSSQAKQQQQRQEKNRSSRPAGPESFFLAKMEATFSHVLNPEIKMHTASLMVG